MLAIVYIIAGYWAAGVVLYENKIVFHAFGQLFIQKLVLGTLFGFVLIPIAILKRLFSK